MLADRYDAFLFDLDGVVYLGERVLPGAAEALKRLRSMGKAIRFLTNDPRPTRAQVVARLDAMGVEARQREVVTSGWATAAYLRRNQIPSAYVIGSSALVGELVRAGIDVVEQGKPAAVVVGCDEHVSYQELRQGTAFIAGGARFIATNADGAFPTESGPCPATGAIVAAIKAATTRRPTIIGNPYPWMFMAALQGMTNTGRIAMVGDNPAIDILGAHQLGLAGILVAQEPVRFPSAQDFRGPDALIPDLSGLFAAGVDVRRWERPAFAWPDRVEAGVAAVVFDRSRQVLLVRRADNGLWGLPSGHVEPGETVADAVVREVREETGLHVTVLSLVGIYSDPVSQVFAYSSGHVSQFITSCFRCEVVGEACERWRRGARCRVLRRQRFAARSLADAPAVAGRRARRTGVRVHPLTSLPSIPSRPARRPRRAPRR